MAIPVTKRTITIRVIPAVMVTGLIENIVLMNRRMRTALIKAFSVENLYPGVGKSIVQTDGSIPFGRGRVKAFKGFRVQGSPFQVGFSFNPEP